MSAKTLGTKIAKLEEKEREWNKKKTALKRDLRRARGRIKEVCESRDRWRLRYRDLENSIKANNTILRGDSGVSNEKIMGHQYNTLVVRLCISVYILGNCGLRSVIRIMSCLCVIGGLELGKLPSKSSLENWLKKLGYSIYVSDLPQYVGCSYSLIIDESMVIGQERMFVILGVSSIKTSLEALGMNQIRILYMGVKPSWTGEQIATEIKKVTEKEGKSPVYIISDKGSTMLKGINTAGLIRIADIGHEVARLTEKHYGGPCLESFLAAAKQSKAKLIMTPSSYLLCPKQRMIARFMNLPPIIEWGLGILQNIDKLNTKEQVQLEWIKPYETLLTELSKVFDTTEKMLKKIKNEGLSYATIEYCLDIFKKEQQSASVDLANLFSDLEAHLKEEKQKLPHANTVWHASSDIIESLFGQYKSRKASNPQHGVTPFILFLPILTRKIPDQECLDIDVKGALEGVLLSDLKAWNRDHLIENQVFKRNKLFKN
jgi:hypothetical protein